MVLALDAHVYVPGHGPLATRADVQNQIDYWDRVFDLKSGLSSRDQIWYWKEVLGLIARSGVVQNYGRSSQVPFYDRFFLGGPDEVRAEIRRLAALLGKGGAHGKSGGAQRRKAKVDLQKLGRDLRDIDER